MEQAHPSFDIVGSLSSLLAGKRIVLCVTGSVAAVRACDIARLLMRHGAAVYPVMSEASTRIIHPDLLHWATGRPPVTRLTGAIEHVTLAGNVAGKADLVIVAPATANTIGKIASGIDDTPVTSTVTNALGSGIPLLIAPAMHESMYKHGIVQENMEKLKKIGVLFLLPAVGEGKAKIAETEEIVATAISLLSAKKLFSGKRVLITLGRTVEYIDPIRVLTNNSSGKMGAALAFAAGLMGAEVTVVAGKVTAKLPSSAVRLNVATSDEMYEVVERELKAKHYNVFIGCAAVGDWKPAAAKEAKISTHKEKKLMLELVPTAKIIDQVKKWSPQTFLVAFRAVHKLGREELIADAGERMAKAGADLIAANDVGKPGSGFETDTNELVVVTPGKEVITLPHNTKTNLAFSLLSIIHEQSQIRKAT